MTSRRALITLLAIAALFASAAHAQGPDASASPASDAGTAATPVMADGGAGESVRGCVETVPKGAQRPSLNEVFPNHGPSGWALTLSITVRHGKGERVLPSGLHLSSAVEAKNLLKQAGFAIPEQDAGAGAQIWTEPDDPQKSTATTHLELPLVPLPPNPGRNVMKLPSLPVAIARANGEIATVCTQEHTIVVEDPIANTPEATPRENPPGLPQREEWTSLKKGLQWTAIGLLAGAVLALLVRWWLNRPKPVPPPPPPRPPWEVAFEELDEIRHAGLLETERYGEHFDRTSDALRRYLGARFGFDGLESTTDEILAALKKHGGGFVRFDSASDRKLAFGPTPGIAVERVEAFLRECDLVKFANLTPTPEQCATSITTGEAIVRATMPVSTGARLDESETAPVRATPAPRPAQPKRVRSPYEPPDPDDGPKPTSDAAPGADTQSKPEPPDGGEP